MIIDIYFQILYVTVLLLVIIILSYYLVRIKNVRKEINESSNIIGIIINELKQRLCDQDKKIIDQDVKLDILELKLNKLLKQNLEKPIINLNDLNINKNKSNVILSNKNKSHDIINYNKTEKLLLNSLINKEYTANELQNIINKTREHTSRLLKKLFNDNVITRDERNKPYVYRLSKNDVIFE